MTRAEKGLCALLFALALCIAGWVLAGLFPPKPVSFTAHGGAEAPLPTAIHRGEKLNLNTCTLEELTAVPGLGKETAEMIIFARDKEPFHFIEDVRTVKGVGEKRLNTLKQYAYVE